MHRLLTMKTFKKSYHSHCQSLRTQQVGKPLCLVGIFNMENEIWKDIVGFNGDYLVSNFGRVKSKDRYRHNDGRYIVKGKALSLVKHDKGYLQVNIRLNGKYKRVFIHRAVASAFILNEQNKPTVNHINGIKNDNRLENLEWATQSENIIHARKTGLFSGIVNAKRLGESHNAVKIGMYSNDNILIKLFDSIANAVLDTGFNKSGICEAAKGKRTHHKGYIWKYTNN